MEMFEIHVLRIDEKGYHVRLNRVKAVAVAFVVMVEGNGHILTKLERPIIKFASQYVAANSNLGILLTTWASFGDAASGIDTSSSCHM
jgi:hypothetical protein